MPDTINDLLKIVKEYNNKKADLEKIKQAYEFSDMAHKGQKRKTGDSYIVHPLATAITLANMKLDAPTIIAGLLHAEDNLQLLRIDDSGVQQQQPQLSASFLAALASFEAALTLSQNRFFLSASSCSFFLCFMIFISCFSFSNEIASVSILRSIASICLVMAWGFAVFTFFGLFSRALLSSETLVFIAA